METFLGKSGRQLWEYANGLDESPVRRFTDEEEIKSIGNGSTFRKDLYTLDEILTGGDGAQRYRRDPLAQSGP